MAFNKENIVQMQLLKFDLFKLQDPETGRYNVTFDIGGKLLYAHENMLNLVSDTFDSMLSDRWTKKDEPIKIKDYSYDDFFQFLTFLYSGQCELTDTNIYSMVDIAEFYGVPLFKKYCDEYLSCSDFTVENVFQLLKFANKYSLVQLKTSVYAYISNDFQSFITAETILKADKNVFDEIVAAVKEKVKPEELFQAVYKWCEKQATDKQAIDSSLNLNDTIKAEISDFLPYVNFKGMDLRFLLEFVVPLGFIFTSLEELSKILCDRHLPTKAKVTNPHGQTLHGNIFPDNILIEAIQFLKDSKSVDNGRLCKWGVTLQGPSTPSPLKKRDGVEWYLVYARGNLFGANGYIGVVNSSMIHHSDFLLAELTPGTSGFQKGSGCKIEMV